jgi:hypothetical protein
MTTNSNAKLYKLTDPTVDLFSDALDRAVSMYHGIRHGVLRNAERAGEVVDGEKLVHRALAEGFKAYLEEIGPHTPETEEPLIHTLVRGYIKSGVLKLPPDKMGELLNLIGPPPAQKAGEQQK